MRLWELSGGILRCPDCGRGLVAVSAWKGYTRKDGTRKRHFHDACATRRQRGKEVCSYSRTPNAHKIEGEVWGTVKAMLLALGTWTAASTLTSKLRRRRTDGRDPEKEARVFMNCIAEVDRKRAAYQDLVADGLMEREELRAKLDALSRQKAAAKEALNAVEERRHKVRELQMSREKTLTHYRAAVSQALEEAEGKQRRTVYNIFGITVWATKTKGIRSG